MLNCKDNNKIQIIPDFLCKYINSDLFIEGTQQLDFDNKIIVFQIQEYNEEGELITNQLDQIQTVSFNQQSNDIPIGLELAIKSMQLNEQAFFQVNESYTLSQKQINQSIENMENISSSKQVYWLIKVENVFKFPFQSTLELEINQYIVQIKEYATNIFKQQFYPAAQTLYSLISQILIGDDLQSSFKTEISRSYTNQAVCFLKMKEWHLVNEKCDQALIIDESNEKAFLLKGRAYFELQDIQQAKDYFLIYKSKTSQKNNNEVEQFISKCNTILEKLQIQF